MPLSVTKAHAFGNDFLFVHRDEARGHDAAALARTLCTRHTGVGGDGLILYSFTAAGATMRLLNADGSPSELSGNGLRCLAALVIRDRERRGGGLEGVSTDVTADTGAGERRLVLTSRAEGRYMFTAAMGQPTDLQQETLTVAGETLVVATLGIGNPQCVALMTGVARSRALRSAGPGPVDPSTLRRGYQRRVRGRRDTATGAHPDLGTRRGSDRGVRHRRLCGSGDGDAVRRSRS